MTPEPLRVLRLEPHAQLPTRAHSGDAAYDVRALEAGEIGPGRRALVRTGIAIALPAGHAGLVLPRSGTAAAHGITLVNAPGLIDEGYRGEVRILLLNTDRDHAWTWMAGDRIAQLVITRPALPDVVEVSDLDETDRGPQGFGSTGLA